jgi:hypothetical protein
MLNKLKNLFLGLILISLFTGCVTQKTTSLYFDENLKAESKLIKIPNLNTEVTVEIGSNMYHSNAYIAKLNEPINKQYSFTAGLFSVSKDVTNGLKIDNQTGWKAICPQNESNYHIVCFFDSKFDKVGAIINDSYSDLEKPISYQ